MLTFTFACTNLSSTQFSLMMSFCLRAVSCSAWIRLMTCPHALLVLPGLTYHLFNCQCRLLPDRNIDRSAGASLRRPTAGVVGWANTVPETNSCSR